MASPDFGTLSLDSEELQRSVETMCLLAESSSVRDEDKETVERTLGSIIENYNPEQNFQRFTETQDLWASKNFVRFVLNHVKDNYDEEMFLEFLNLCASAEDSEKQLVNFGVIGPLLSKIMDDEWNERAQVLGFKAIGCLSIDRDVRAYLGARGASEVLNNGLFRVQDDLESVVSCLKSVTNFLYHCKTNKEMAVSSKVGKTLLLILEDHSDSDEVHEWAANFLRSLGRADGLNTAYRSKFLEVLLKRNFDSVFPITPRASESPPPSPPSQSPLSLHRAAPSPAPKHSPSLIFSSSTSPPPPAIEIVKTSLPVSRAASHPLAIPHLSLPPPSPHPTPQLPSPRSYSPSCSPSNSFILPSPSISPSNSNTSLAPPLLLVSTLWASIQLIANKKEAKEKFVELDGLLFAFSSLAYYGAHAGVALPGLTLLSILVKVSAIRTKISEFFWHPEVFLFIFTSVGNSFTRNESVLRAWAKFLFRMCGDSDFRSKMGKFFMFNEITCKGHYVVPPLLHIWSHIAPLTFPIHKILLLLALQLTKSQAPLAALRASLSSTHTTPTASSTTAMTTATTTPNTTTASTTAMPTPVKPIPRSPVKAKISLPVSGTRASTQDALLQLLNRYNDANHTNDKDDLTNDANAKKELIAKLSLRFKLAILNDNAKTNKQTNTNANTIANRTNTTKAEPLVIKLDDGDDDLNPEPGPDAHAIANLNKDPKNALSPRTRQDLLRTIRAKKTREMKEEMEKLALKKPRKNPQPDKIQRRKSFHASHLPSSLERFPKNPLTSSHPAQIQSLQDGDDTDKGKEEVELFRLPAHVSPRESRTAVHKLQFLEKEGRRRSVRNLPSTSHFKSSVGK